jgi:hypothetical protein
VYNSAARRDVPERAALCIVIARDARPPAQVRPGGMEELHRRIGDTMLKSALLPFAALIIGFGVAGERSPPAGKPGASVEPVPPGIVGRLRPAGGEDVVFEILNNTPSPIKLDLTVLEPLVLTIYEPDGSGIAFYNHGGPPPPGPFDPAKTVFEVAPGRSWASAPTAWRESVSGKEGHRYYVACRYAGTKKDSEAARAGCFQAAIVSNLVLVTVPAEAHP